jgi:hypothetical protein
MFWKKGNDLWPLISNFALQFTIMNFQENEEGMELNGIHHLLFHSNINMLVENVSTIKKNTKALLEASREVFI